jgi:UDP-N-acetylglucosamine transferase subunit ALG13
VGNREDETARLRALHDEAVWQVNAAVADGRYDLVTELTDEYVEAALRELTSDHAHPCPRPQCPSCGRELPAPRRRRWWRRPPGRRPLGR